MYCPTDDKVRKKSLIGMSQAVHLGKPRGYCQPKERWEPQGREKGGEGKEKGREKRGEPQSAAEVWGLGRVRMACVQPMQIVIVRQDVRNKGV
jgi:hypothetical protein